MVLRLRRPLAVVEAEVGEAADRPVPHEEMAVFLPHRAAHNRLPLLQQVDEVGEAAEQAAAAAGAHRPRVELRIGPATQRTPLAFS